MLPRYQVCVEIDAGGDGVGQHGVQEQPGGGALPEQRHQRAQVGRVLHAASLHPQSTQ